MSPAPQLSRSTRESAELRTGQIGARRVFPSHMNWTLVSGSLLFLSGYLPLGLDCQGNV